jgi:hypothetical protein
MKGLDRLIKQIGKKSTQQFLKLSQTQLKQDHQELLRYLTLKEWQKSAEKAHYLKATANLYASDSLLEYYSFIIDKKEKIEPDFIGKLTQELKKVEEDIQVFLEKMD